MQSVYSTAPADLQVCWCILTIMKHVQRYPFKILEIGKNKCHPGIQSLLKIVCFPIFLANYSKTNINWLSDQLWYKLVTLTLLHLMVSKYVLGFLQCLHKKMGYPCIKINWFNINLFKHLIHFLVDWLDDIDASIAVVKDTISHFIISKVK